MKGSRPGNSTLGVNLCVEFDVQVENTQILNLEPKHTKERPLKAIA